MAEQLKIDIEALDRFQDIFRKFIKTVDDTRAAEADLTKTTEAADNAVTEFVETVGDQGVAAMAEMAQAVDRAERAETDLTKTTQQTERAVSGLSQMTEKGTYVFVNYTNVQQRTRESTERTRESTEKTKDTLSDFFAVVGQFGTLYALQHGLESVINTGANFERTIRSVQVVTDDFSDTLSRTALSATEGMQGPNAIAAAYDNLGAAGLRTNDILGSTTDILDFATAAQIDMANSAEAVIAGAKSFQIEIGRAGEITDAYTAAMGAGSLAGDDFTAIMASAGAVAKQANQDFRELLAAASGMRDAGVGAQDGATSIKSALLALINPTDEARKLMQQLGIDVYDSSGNMLQWHQIVANVTAALAPYNQASRNMALATIFGSDGIRAMSVSMGVGADKLAALVDEMKNASGATEHVADVMANTTSGAAQQLGGNFERLQVALFDELNPALRDGIGLLNDLAVGFLSLDDGTQSVLITLIGGAGIVIALTTVAGMIRKVTLELGLLNRAMWLNPWTAAAAAIGAVVTAFVAYTSAASKAKQEAQELVQKQQELNQLLAEANFSRSQDDLSQLQERLKHEDELNALYERRQEIMAKMADATNLPRIDQQVYQQTALRKELAEVDKQFAELGFSGAEYQKQLAELKADIQSSVPALLSQRQAEIDSAIAAGQHAAQLRSLKAEYDKLTNGQSLSAEQQQRLNEVISKIKNELPAAIVTADKYGRQQLKNADYVEQRVAIEESSYAQERNALVDWLSNLRTTTQQEADQLAQRLENWRKFQAGLQRTQQVQSEPLLKLSGPIADVLQIGQNQMQSLLGSQGQDLLDQQNETQQKLAQLDDLIEQLRHPSAGGGQSLTLPGSGSGGAGGSGSALDGMQSALAAIAAQLDPVTARTAALSDAVSLLGSKTQYLQSVYESGKGTIKDLNALDKMRDEQVQALRDHQAQLAAENVKSADVQRQLQALAAGLTAQYKAGKISASDYAEGTRSITSEMNSLSSAMRQNSQAWWDDQSAILAAQQAADQFAQQLKAARERQRDDAYQSAMALMQHEVALSRMSTEQQIKYLEILRDSTTWSQSQMWDLEESIFDLRKKAIDDLMQKRKQERDTEIQAIEDEFEARRAAIESESSLQTKAIDAAERQRQRQQLQDKADLYARATSEQGQKTYQETLEQLRQMDLEDSKQAIEDDKQAKLDALDDEEDQFKKSLDKLQQAYEQNGDDMVALEQLAQDARVMAVNEGNDRIRQLWADLAKDYGDVAEQMQPSTSSPSGSSAPVFTVPTPVGSNYKPQLEAVLQQKMRYGLATNESDRKQAHDAAESILQGLPAEIANLSRSYSADQLREYIASLSTGGKTMDEGLAYLHPDEVVVRAPVVQRIEAMADVTTMLSAGFDRLASEIRALQLQQIHIERLIEVNDPVFEDGIDLRALGQEAETIATSMLRRQMVGGAGLG